MHFSVSWICRSNWITFGDVIRCFTLFCVFQVMMQQLISLTSQHSFTYPLDMTDQITFIAEGSFGKVYHYPPIPIAYKVVHDKDHHLQLEDEFR
jgi:hypothetical protein